MCIRFSEISLSNLCWIYNASWVSFKRESLYLNETFPGSYLDNLSIDMKVAQTMFLKNDHTLYTLHLDRAESDDYQMCIGYTNNSPDQITKLDIPWEIHLN